MSSRLPPQLATLLVSCPDRRGIVAALAQVLAGHGANILDSDQHTDRQAGQFFQRICFETSELTTDRLTLRRAIDEVAGRFSMKCRVEFSTDEEGRQKRKRIAIFVSKYDHCLYDLLLRHRAGEIDGDLALVVSNHPDLGPVAEQFGIPFHHLPVSKATQREQEQQALELLRSSEIDLVVLARYMQILSAEFVAEYPERIINIHHSFLPAFVGGRPYHQAYERGVKLVGATAHYATSQLDEGPIIEQDVVRCSHRDSVEDLVRKGKDLEKSVLARAVRWHLESRVLAYDNKTVVFS
ncbi:MAG: formyltetrahydrofolate deformylase [Myxococcales bacterium]|jgi:formyltetrahydrofolate deformylase|nr:formyltetrahydrofolate deformylase [Myxococcales bacterium]